jgi:signal recognition particle receptor subunit beta
LKGVPLLVLANKQDLPEAANDKEISEVMGLSKIKERDWAIFTCSATTGKGLNESLDWVVDRLTPLL